MAVCFSFLSGVLSCCCSLVNSRERLPFGMPVSTIFPTPPPPPILSLRMLCPLSAPPPTPLFPPHPWLSLLSLLSTQSRNLVSALCEDPCEADPVWKYITSLNLLTSPAGSRGCWGGLGEIRVWPTLGCAKRTTLRICVRGHFRLNLEPNTSA